MRRRDPGHVADFLPGLAPTRPELLACADRMLGVLLGDVLDERSDAEVRASARALRAQIAAASRREA